MKENLDYSYYQLYNLTQNMVACMPHDSPYRKVSGCRHSRCRKLHLQAQRRHSPFNDVDEDGIVMCLLWLLVRQRRRQKRLPNVVKTAILIMRVQPMMGVDDRSLGFANDTALAAPLAFGSRSRAAKFYLRPHT